MNKIDIAKKAALSYFGLSSGTDKTDKLPKGVIINVYDNFDTKPQKAGFLEEVCKKLDTIWTENIGALSRTARLSLLDFLWYVNELREEHGAEPITPKSSLIENLMKNIVDIYDDVVFVEIINSTTRKILLVNTKITL